MRQEFDTLRWAFRQLELKPWAVCAAVAFGVLGAGSAVALIGSSAWLIARAAQQPSIGVLGLVVVAVRALGITRGVFRYLERLRSHDVALAALANLRAKLFGELARAPLTVVTRLRGGTWLARLGRDVDAVGDTVIKGMLPCVVAAVIGVCSAVAVALVSPSAAVVYVVGFAGAGVVAPLLAARSARAALGVYDQAHSELVGSVHELVQHRAEFEVAGLLPGQLRDVVVRQDQVELSLRRAAVLRGVADGLVVLGTLVAVVGVAVCAVADVGSMSNPVWYSVAVLLALASFEVLVPLPAAAQELVRGALAAGRLRAVAAESGAAESGAAVEVESGAGEVLVPAEVSSVSWSGLAASWPGSRVVQVSDGVARRGQLVHVLGHSGSGKSTWLMTAAGLLPAVAGEFLWHSQQGAVSAHRVDPKVAAQVCSAAFEDSYVFATTIRENLQLISGPVSDAELLAALDVVCLRSWVLSLPGGLAERLTSGGANISGGERRRLVTARALVSGAAVVVLDEPTEHLDPQTARQVWANISEWARVSQRIVLAASHEVVVSEFADQQFQLQQYGALSGGDNK